MRRGNLMQVKQFAEAHLHVDRKLVKHEGGMATIDTGRHLIIVSAYEDIGHWEVSWTDTKADTVQEKEIYCNDVNDLARAFAKIARAGLE